MLEVSEWVAILKKQQPELEPVIKILEGQIRQTYFAGQLSVCGYLNGIETYKEYEVEVQKLKRKIKDKGLVVIGVRETTLTTTP